MRLVRAEARPRRVDLGAMARGHCEELLAREPDRRVELRIPDALWVQADPELAHVIVSALLDNAFKFTRNRTPAIVEVGPYPRGFYVRDNGAGFDMAYADKLFRTFETLHGPGEFEGLGLGLAIAARAAASHGGRIEADSRPGHGATFFVILGGTGPGARATSTDRSEIEPPAGEASRASERSSAGQPAPVDVSGRAPAGSATR
jgi:signal transduction histidine kinase